MRRLLIFLLLFPAIATAAFYAVIAILTGATADSGTGPVFMCLLFIAPALLVAAIDVAVSRSSLPTVLATTLLTYVLFVLVMALLLGPSLQCLTLGLIGAIPAAICSRLAQTVVAHPGANEQIVSGES